MNSQLRIVFSGPESCGKSYLSQLVSEHYNSFLVDEFARIYLEKKVGGYDLTDLKKIEEGQQLVEKQARESGYHFIIQDTDFLTIWIWYIYKYSLNPDRVYNYLQRHLPSHYMLCYPDIPWKQDTLRENQYDRYDLFAIYEHEINRLHVPYTVIKGDYQERTDLTFSTIEKLR